MPNSANQSGAAPTGVLEAMAALVHSVRFEDLPAEVVSAVTVRALDKLGCAFGTLDSDVGRAVRRLAADCGGAAQATLIGTGEKTSAPLATLVNGSLLRYLDSIDYYFSRDPAHGDVDIVVQLEMLSKTDAYHSLEENLKKMDFERNENDRGEKVSWRWRAKTEKNVSVILELLADNPELSGGKVKPLPTEGTISALNIPHSSMVFDHHEEKEIRAELLGGGGIAVEKIRYADIVSFTCLKAFALDQRHENKDAHDIVYCIENAEGGLDATAKKFTEAGAGKHAKVIDNALTILRKRFADDAVTEGYRKDGSVAVARFEIDGEDEEVRERRVLRQRQVSDLIMRFLKAVG